MIIQENTLTAGEFHTLFSAVGWDPPGLEQIQQALSHSLCTFAIYDNGTVIGMARLLGDSAMSFYLKDFAILPARQSMGVGRTLMEYILNWIRSSLPHGYRASLELISAAQKEPFYRKFGFEDRPNSWDGAGMFQMIGSKQ